MRLTRRTIAAAALALAATLTLPALASATTQRAHLDQTTAILSYSGPQYQATHQRLRIVRAGHTLVDQQVTLSGQCGSSCVPIDVRVLDLENDGEPDVVLTVFTGGAHCCTWAKVYRYNGATHRYGEVTQYFGNGAFVINRIGGQDVFVTTNDAFYYEFTSFAESGAPVQILALSGSRFVDVTRLYPKVINQDAAAYWKYVRTAPKDGATEGVFADWAADEYLLGKASLVAATLKAQIAKGNIRGDFAASKYTAALTSFLHAQGYAP